MNRKNFLLKSLLQLAFQLMALFTVSVALYVSTLMVVSSLLLVLAVTYYNVRLISQRLKDIAPNTDVGLLYGAFFLVCLLTSGLAYVSLFFLPTNFVHGSK